MTSAAQLHAHRRGKALQAHLDMLPDDTGGLLWAYDYWQSPSPQTAAVPVGTAVEPARRLGHLPRNPPTQALVSEADYIAAQDSAPPAAPSPGRRSERRKGAAYLLAGLPGAAARAGGGWNRRGPTAGPPTAAATATPAPARPTPGRPRNALIREDRVLPHLPALHLLLTGADDSEGQRRRRTRRGADARHHASPEDVIRFLRENQDHPDLRPGRGHPARGQPAGAATRTVTLKAS